MRRDDATPDHEPVPSDSSAAIPALSEDRWRALEPLLDAALALAPQERARFVDEACGGDVELHADLARLLAECEVVDDVPGAFDRPAGEQFATLMGDPDLAMDATMSALAAALAGQYVLERELGGGGMARVFLATETALGRRVVVKMLAPELAAELSAERFAREVLLAAQLQHPNIVPLLTAGAAGSTPYFTMPFVDGASLRARLARLGPGEIVPTAEAVGVLRDVARALAYANGRGVVHRDVKPENILLAHEVAVVADFGIAKAMAESRGPQAAAGSHALTQLGASVGTPAYMAPEQAAGDPDVGPAADVYAWGLVAYELFTGTHPFAGRHSPYAMIAAQLTEMPPPLAERRPDLRPVLASLVMRCLAKDPLERPVDGRALAHALSAADSALASGADPGVNIAALPGTGDPLRWRPSVAVLPMVNTSGDPENEHFSDGLTDDLIGALSQVGSLAVTGRTSSFALKGRDFSVREIAGMLRVAHLLEGTVRRSGDRLKVRMQLVDADGAVLWSDVFDRRLTDVFAVQEEIAQAVVRSLAVRLGAGRGPLVRPPTADLAAYDLYLRGMSFRRRLTPDDLASAVACLEEAVARDAGYARAFAALSDAHFLAAVLTGQPPADVIQRARTHAQRALVLDPALPEGHWALAQVLFAAEWDWLGAEREFGAALALDPGSVDARHLRAISLLCRRDFAEAEAELTRTLAAEPLLPELHNTLARVYIGSRQPERAVGSLREALALAPGFTYARASLGHAYLMLGRLEDALIEFRQAAAGGGAMDVAQLAYAYAACGRRADAVATLAPVIDSASGTRAPPFQVAMAYAGLGDTDAAFTWLERACAERDLHVAGLDALPAFDSLRSDSRFAALLRQMLLVA